MNIIKHKKLNKARGVTIPKDLAAATGIFAGNGIDLVETENGILLRNHVPVCRFCGSVESVGKIKGEEICAKCASELRAEIDKIFK